MRLSVNLPGRLSAELQALAACRAVTVTATISRAILAWKLVEDARDNGAVFTVAEADGSSHDVVFL